MQIFSKLQRNSTNYIFAKLIFYFFAAVLNSEYLFFPLLIGFLGFSEDILISSYYFAVFSIFHNISIVKSVYFLIFLIFFSYYLKDKIKDYVNPVYQPVVGIGIIYLFFLPVIGFDEFNIYYILYNITVDIIIYKILYRN
jgi:hypothetical protein